MMEYSISDVSQKLNISKDTLRYYEKINLITSVRKENSYRTYDDTSLSQIKYIQLLKHVGFSLTDIKNLFELYSSSSSEKDGCVNLETYKNKILEIENKIANLTKIKMLMQEFTDLFIEKDNYQQKKFDDFIENTYQSIHLK